MFIGENKILQYSFKRVKETYLKLEAYICILGYNASPYKAIKKTILKDRKLPDIKSTLLQRSNANMHNKSHLSKQDIFLLFSI